MELNIKIRNSLSKLQRISSVKSKLKFSMEKSRNRQDPANEGYIIIIPSQGTTSIAGIYYHYKEYYPPELEPFIDFNDYQEIITDINETIKSNWPCFFTVCLGYVLCPFTLGLSLFLPRICLGDLESQIHKIVDSANKNFLIPKGATMIFKKESSKSWFEIRLPKSEMPRSTRKGIDRQMANIETNFPLKEAKAIIC